MSASPKPPSDRSVHIGGNASGNVIQTGDRNTAALKSYEQSLAIAERLAQADPRNAQAQRDIAVSYSKVGMVFEALNRSAEA